MQCWWLRWLCDVTMLWWIALWHWIVLLCKSRLLWLWRLLKVRLRRLRLRWLCCVALLGRVPLRRLLSRITSCVARLPRIARLRRVAL